MREIGFEDTRGCEEEKLVVGLRFIRRPSAEPWIFMSIKADLYTGLEPDGLGHTQ
jgi:hypothetical protein